MTTRRPPVRLLPLALTALVLGACTSTLPPSGVTTASVDEASESANASPSPSAAATPSAEASTEASPEPADPATAVDPTQVQIFFSNADSAAGNNCGAVQGFMRDVPEGADRLEESMILLLAGPTEDEVAAGAMTGFSESTAGKLRHTYIEASVAYVDMVNFAGDQPNWSASCGSEQLLGQLDSTVNANAPVNVDICYSFEGNLGSFYGWIQWAVPDHCDQAILDSIIGG